MDLVRDYKVSKQEMINALKESMLSPSYYLLNLTPTESEFNYIEKIENNQPSEGRLKIRMAVSGNGTLYKNLNEKISLRSQDFAHKKYIIADTLQNINWKISRESKEILGYEVRKAEAQIDSANTAIAWYAPKLSYKNGPDNYDGLPGLILEIVVSDNSDDEKRKSIYKAISIKVDNNPSPIDRPKKGETVTQKQFDAIIKKQQEKYKDMQGGGVDKE